MAYDVGDQWNPQLTVKDATGTLTAATVVLSVTSPSGIVTTPAVTPGTTGVYTATVPLTEVGRWQGVWTVSGTVVGVEVQHAYVRVLGSNVISVADVKTRANKTLTVDDAEIEAMIDAAEAEYVQRIGPISGTYTERFSGYAPFVLGAPNASAITSATYSDGTVVTSGDLDLNVSNGIIDWAYGNRAAYYQGSGFKRYLSITYTVGALPAHHREVIIADVAGYFEATQNNEGGAAFPGEGYEAAYAATPQVLFPRIRELARTFPKIA